MMMRDDDREVIRSLAEAPAADDPDVDLEAIASLNQPGAAYDVIVMLCRAVDQLLGDVDELRRQLPSRN